MTRPASRAARLRLGALLATGAVALMVLAGCSSAGSSSSTTTTATVDPGTTSETAPPVRVFTDPAQPISVVLGEQFAIVLPAQPGAGKSWQPAGGPSLQILVSIGTEFQAPEPAVTDQTQPDDTVSQVLRYAARSPGTTTITLRYGQPGAAQPDDQTLTFSVVVVDPSVPTTAPPATDATTTVALTPTTAARTPTTTAKAHTTTTP